MARNEYYLMHHGVKGMKWGVRRTPEQLGHKKSSSTMRDNSVEGRYAKAAEAMNAWVDRYDKLESDLDFGKIDYDTYEKKAKILDKEYEKLNSEYTDAATKFRSKVENSKEYKELQRTYDHLNEEYKKAFDNNDDKKMMDILSEMENVESASLKLYELHHADSFDNYLVHHGVKGMRWGVRRSPEQLGHRTFGERAKAKLNDPEFKRKAAKAAKIALVIGAAYATHKVVNDPKVLAAGKDALTKVVAKSGAVKASALKNVMDSTEFKVAKAAIDNSGAVKDAAKAVAGGAGKVLKKIGSEETRNVVTGIGAMAGTTAILRSQIKDFRENKPDGDKFDRAIKRTQQLSEIGENVNTLARGPKGASSNSSSSSNSNSSTSNNQSSNVSVFTDSHTGAPIRANKKLSKEDKNKIKQYRASHPNMTLREALDELGWLDKDEAKHSSISTGWHFNRAAKNYYIF